MVFSIRQMLIDIFFFDALPRQVREPTKKNKLKEELLRLRPIPIPIKGFPIEGILYNISWLIIEPLSYPILFPIAGLCPSLVLVFLLIH